jgi:arylsulfatase A-like enzyme
VEERVQTIDVMPTLLDLCGLGVPHEAQGRSLVPLVAAAGRRRAADALHADSAASSWVERPAVSEKAPITDLGGPPPRSTSSVALISGDWKVIANIDRPAGDPEYELYDHRRDPLDQTDVSAEHKDVVERLAREIKAWKASAEAARLKPDSESGRAMTQEELERLRALGYIQ